LNNRLTHVLVYLIIISFAIPSSNILAVQVQNLNTFEMLDNEASASKGSKHISQSYASEINNTKKDNGFFNLNGRTLTTQGLKGPIVIPDQQINKITMEINTRHDKMNYELRAEDRYLKGNPVIINFTLHNLTNEHLWVLRWYTPLEGIKGKIFHVVCDGKEIPYDGPMVKRGDPTKNEYTPIDPGRSVSSKVDLSSVYELPLSQECVVQFKNVQYKSPMESKIHDFSTSSDLIPKKKEQFKEVTISGNSVTFRLVDS
jgi:hypothetical protein